MIAWLLISQVVIVPNAPSLPPAEAAALLARLDSPANRTHVFVCTDCDGLRSASTGSQPGDGPFGALPQYSFPPLNCCSA